MGKVDIIIVHCSATKADSTVNAAVIDKWHRQRGFKRIGYHFVVDVDGTVEMGRPLTMVGAHCNCADVNGVSYNKHSIGICYVGGYDSKGKAADTRTDAQKDSLARLIAGLCRDYNITRVMGHRDTFPDINGDGKIDKRDWMKDCPCFDAEKEYSVFIRKR